MHKYTKISDFHGSRSKGVGSSDIPTLALLNLRYGSTPLTLWEEKTGRREGFSGNNRTYWGNQLEGLVLREAVYRRERERLLGSAMDPAEIHAQADAIGEEFYKAYLRDRSSGIYKVKTECRHPDYKFALAHADLLVDDGAGWIQEAKTTGFMAGRRKDNLDKGYDEEDQGKDGIPAGVFLQVQWQQFCYGVDGAGVSVLIDTADYRQYGPIKADPRTQEKCLALAERFWWHVEHDTPPKPETWEDVQALFPHQTDTTAMIGGDEELKVLEMIERSKSIKGRIKASEEELDEIKNALGILIGGNSVLATAEGKILAKASERSRESVSLSTIAKKAPEIEARLRELGLVSVSGWRDLRF